MLFHTKSKRTWSFKCLKVFMMQKMSLCIRNVPYGITNSSSMNYSGNGTHSKNMQKYENELSHSFTLFYMRHNCHKFITPTSHFTQGSSDSPLHESSNLWFKDDSLPCSVTLQLANTKPHFMTYFSVIIRKLPKKELLCNLQIEVKLEAHRTNIFHSV